MSILDRLHELGERLRILEARPQAGAVKPVKIPTRTVTLAQLTSEIRQDELRALADDGCVMNAHELSRYVCRDRVLCQQAG